MRKIFISFSLLMLCAALFSQKSPNISRVLEYRPAPGQHINRMFPSAAMSDTPENALKFAENALIDNKSMLGLGGYGGYVIVGFDHPIVNVKGEYDFKALGNAFKNNAEPGIVMVCQDLNKNGKPDENEPWYELAGSEYAKPETIKNYEITYYRPNPDGQKSAIRWTDNQGGEGSVPHIGTQSTMYPLWIAENTQTFKGTKLRNTVVSGGMITLTAFDWGYVDNHANLEPVEKIGFNIEWAVDSEGNAVNLTHVDFIKVYTGQLQQAGFLGETSTEIAGIVDLHPDAELILANTNSLSNSSIEISISNENLTIKNIENVQGLTVFNLQGNILINNVNQNNIDISAIPNGIYILKVTHKNNKQYIHKFIKQ